MVGVEIITTILTAAALAAFLYYRLEKIMVDMTAHAADLRAMKVQNEKSRAESQAALKKLQDAIDKAGGTTPEVDEAMAELRASLQVEDDDHADLPPTEPV